MNYKLGKIKQASEAGNHNLFGKGVKRYRMIYFENGKTGIAVSLKLRGSWVHWR